MDDSFLKKKLSKIGLSKNEACVYCTLLRLGPSSAACVAKESTLKRPTAYLALDQLAKLGLVAEVHNRGHKIFKAEGPERLLHLTRKMRREVIQAELDLEQLMPGLKAMQKKIFEMPKVKFYQGAEGLKTIIMEASEHLEPWYYFGSVEELATAWSSEGLNDFVEETRVMRVKAGQPKFHIITDSGYFKIKLFQKNEPNIRQVKILPNLLNTKSGFVIYGNKLGIISVGETPFGTIVESKEVTELIKIMYNLIWDSLPETKIKNN